MVKEVPFLIDYEPHSPPQEHFHHYCEAPGVKTIALISGIRYGKTFAGRAQLLKWILEQKPVTTAEGRLEAAPLSWIVGPDYKTAAKACREFRNLAGPLVKKFIKGQGAAEMWLEMPAGLRGYTRERWYRVQVKTGQSPESFRAEDVAYIWMDEGAFCVREVYLNCLGRVMNTKGRIIITTTPLPIDEKFEVQQWIKTDIVDVSRDEPDGDVKVVFARTEDRPHFRTPEGIVELTRLKKRYGPSRFAQECDGRFIAISSLLFPDFEYTTHVCDSYELPVGCEVFAGIDFGIAVPSVVAYYAVVGEQIVGCSEIVLINKGPEELCEAIRNHPLHPLCRFYYADYGGAAERDVLARRGIETLAGYKDFVTTYGYYRDLLIGKTSDGRPKIQWMMNCANGIREMMHTRVPRSGLGKVKNNHYADASRYALYTHLVGRPTSANHKVDPNAAFRGVPRHLLPPSIEKKLYGFISGEILYHLDGDPMSEEGYNPTYGNYNEKRRSQAHSDYDEDESAILPDGS